MDFCDCNKHMHLNESAFELKRYKSYKFSFVLTCMLHIEPTH